MAAQDLHMHTTFCDGKSTPEEMVRSAIEKGLKRVGICTHAYVPFDSSYCLSPDRYGEFRSAVSVLKEQYAGKIEVLCGIEQDLFSPCPTDGFDYVIGSAHYVRVGEEYLSVDYSKKYFVHCCERFFNGDYLAFAEAYYETVSHVFEKTKCDIIGHIDLITKFNEGGQLFDEADPRYTDAYTKAVHALLASGKPFEINTGAISRGYRTLPYPSSAILRMIRAEGGKTLLSSDAHCAQDVAFLFEQYENY